MWAPHRDDFFAPQSLIASFKTFRVTALGRLGPHQVTLLRGRPLFHCNCAGDQVIVGSSQARLFQNNGQAVGSTTVETLKDTRIGPPNLLSFWWSLRDW